MGKRVNFCARVVATCDAFLLADQVGLPYQVLQRITKPLVVQMYNLEYATRMLHTGQVHFMQKYKNPQKWHISFVAEQTLTLQSTDILVRDGRKYRINANCSTPPVPYTVCALPLNMTTIDNRIQVRMCVGDRVLRDGQFLNPLNYIKWPKLDVGDELLVLPQEGDYILFNRQPTLVEESMLGMRVVPLPIQLFACNCAAIEALRGDYDGDEINVHFPQSPAAEAELQNIMALQHQIATGQGSKPVVRLIHDAIVTAFWLTRCDRWGRPMTHFTRGEWQHLCCSMPLAFDQIIHRQHEMRKTYAALCIAHPTCYVVSCMDFEEYRYTGLALMSMMLPTNLHFTGARPRGLLEIYLRLHNIPQDRRQVQIFAGLLHAGVFDAASLTAKHGLLHHLYVQHRGCVAQHFINCMQILTAHVTMRCYNLTVSLDDCRLPQSLLSVCNAYTQRVIAEVLHKQEDVCINPVLNTGTLLLELSITVQRVNEERVVRYLCRNRLDRGSMPNNMLLLTILGSKGSISNILQTTYCLGQQVIQGGRVQPNVHGKFFPHAFCGSQSSSREQQLLDLRNRGLVYTRNFFMGLSPIDFFIHAMAGREALVEGATSTAQSGYAMRLAMKMLEHNTSHYDHTIRDQYGNIVQFLYASDGFDRRFTWHCSPLNVLAVATDVLQQCTGVYK